jgi:cyclopropane fatty-acyl-phospholipid synthase-like methyltransferase
MRLTTAGKNKILDFYHASYNKSPHNNSAAVGWSSQYGQLVRFMVLDKVGNLDGASILDVGSGVGDFYAYLNNKHKNFNYLGIDIMNDFVITAQKQFPKGNFSNMELADIKESFDYVICSGALNAKIPDYKDVYFSMIKNMYNLAKTAVAFNILDTRHHENDHDFAAFHPEEVLEFCRGFAKKAALISGYLKWDATIFLYH